MAVCLTSLYVIINPITEQSIHRFIDQVRHLFIDPVIHLPIQASLHILRDIQSYYCLEQSLLGGQFGFSWGQDRSSRSGGSEQCLSLGYQGGFGPVGHAGGPQAGLEHRHASADRIRAD